MTHQPETITQRSGQPKALRLPLNAKSLPSVKEPPAQQLAYSVKTRGWICVARFAAAGVILLALTSAVIAGRPGGDCAPRFHLTPGGNDPDGDLEFQAALSNSFTEFDFEEYSDFDLVDTLSTPDVTVDLKLLNADGSVYADVLMVRYFCDGCYPEIFDGHWLVNQSETGVPSDRTGMLFEFSAPVEGFGTWVFDDQRGTTEQFVMEVTERGGATTISPVLDSGNVDGAHAIEGFLGVTSVVGIERVVIWMQVHPTGEPRINNPFEVDHLQVGSVMPMSDDCNGNGLPDTCDPDADADGIPDECDNCVTVSNPDQRDCNGNGVGDLCEAGLFITSAGTDSVKCYDPTTGAYRGDYVPPNAAGLDQPFETVRAPDGAILVTGQKSNQILRCVGNDCTEFITGFGLHDPSGITIGPDGHIYIGNFSGDNVLRFDGASGAPLPAPGQAGAVFVPFRSGGLDGAGHVTFGPDGNLYVQSRWTGQILRYDGVTGAAMGVFVDKADGGLCSPGKIIFGPDGHFYVVNNGACGAVNSVLRYDGESGSFLDAFVQSGDGGLADARSIVFGPHDGALYVMDTHADSVKRFSGVDGTYIDDFISSGLGGLDFPVGMEFIADCNGNGAPDDCDPDTDGDGVPDDCEASPALISVYPSLGEHANRDWYISPQSRWVGFTEVQIEVSDLVDLVAPDAWCMMTTGSSAPDVIALLPDGGGNHTVHFSGPIEVGEWTTLILHVRNAVNHQSDLCFHLGHLPGDVNNDGQMSLADASRFGQMFGAAPPKLCDLNGDGQCTLADASAFGAIANGSSGEGVNTDGTGGWLGLGLPTRPACACP